MNYAKIFLVISSLLFLSGCSNKSIYKSTYQDTTLKVGEENSSLLANMHYDPKSEILYGISNDNQNLYASLKIIDEIMKKKILHTGLTFWIDTTGKAKEQLGLTFPIQMNPRQNDFAKNNRMSSKQELDKKNIQVFNNNFVNGNSEIEIVGYYGDPEPRLVGNKSNDGINAILKMDSLQTLYYEVAIPLDMIFMNPDEWLNNPDKYFSFIFETGQMEMPPMRSGGGGPGGGGPGGGGSGGSGPGGGGSGGSGPGGANSGQDNMAEMQEMTQVSRIQVKKASLSNNSN